MENGRENIVIRQAPAFTAATLRSGGWSDPEKIGRKTEELRTLLARDGRTPVPPSLSARYNPPWTIPPFRRNEIIARILRQRGFRAWNLGGGYA
jgi:hypothetical protein